ncbi:DUF3352 domain-containing protein [Synechococcus sp. RSCCF101]|uniref:DUF3352 domain-containing protein n=1 Tax=Synechococcus sp. RSCCF101 TaxID=2511069 RepID=UPI001244CD4F|nr:DUF3352 domain-containing protein [Synechococcus sp. RSCCF101]QEY32866.1 DUF3352 domain-containing protein [Synechococcus sp. RSCCF101]
MAARRFLATLLAVALVGLGLGTGGWLLALRQSPLHQARQALSVPEAARFIPRRAPLTLHWFTAADWPARYAASVAPTRRREQAADALRRLRDGLFASAGLDYGSELAGWLGDEVSLSVLEPREGDAPSGWLLALRSRDEEGARRFLQRFWQIRSLAGADLTVSSYRGMGLISGRGSLLGSPPRPLATALINDRLVLIASGRGVLEEALDVSQIDELNLAADPDLGAAVERLGSGVGLLTARGGGLDRWLAVPSTLSDRGPQASLVAAIQPQDRTLAARVLLPWPAQPSPALSPSPSAAPATKPAATMVTSAELLERAGRGFDALALIDQPAALLQATAAGDPDGRPGVPSPWVQGLGPILRGVLDREAGPLLQRLARADAGPLLLAWRQDGWLVGTDRDQPPLAELSERLRLDGLAESPLVLDEVPLRIWSRLAAAPGRSGRLGELDASLVGARLEGEGRQAWWSNRLELLRDHRLQPSQPGPEVRRLQALDAERAPVALTLANPVATSLLSRWLPWTLLQGLAAQPLAPVVEGLDLVLEPLEPDAAERPLAELQARLRFSG